MIVAFGRKHFAAACAIVAIGAALQFPLRVSFVIVWAVLLLLIATLSRKRLLILVGFYVLISSLVAQAKSGLDFPNFPHAPPEVFNGVVMKLPDINNFAVSVDVSTRWGRFELQGTKQQLAKLDVGQNVLVHGDLKPIAANRDVRARHLRATVDVESIELNGRQWWSTAPAFIRSLVADSGNVLGENRGLYLGFVIGDERGITQDLTQTFQSSGMSHLLVVSGQNLAFLMVLASPLLSRCRNGARFILLSLITIFFIALTGFEPSVLRAAAMVMVGSVGLFTTARMTGLQRLAAAFVLCLLIDPLLVYSRGFQLSASATFGIVLFSARLIPRLRGPMALRQIMAITISAQLGVLPFALLYFGSLPSVSVLTNTSAEPIAGIVMMWGSSVGVLAGALPSFPRFILQLPMVVCLWWLRFVAEIGAHLPFPRLGLVEVGVIALGCGLIMAMTVLGRRVRVWAG